MNKLLVKNGLVYDPLNNIKGEKKDILIEQGKIVEKFSSESDVKEIDALNKTVIPAGIDIHSHFASQQINWARLLGSTDTAFTNIWQGLSLEAVAKAYIANGYTFLLEANTFPSLARQTIFNFKYMPVVDTAMLLNVSTLWVLESEFERGKIDELAIFLSDLLSVTKGFGIKAYNPFEAEAWNFDILRENIETKGKLYNFSALDVYLNLTKAVEQMNLPHSIHAHVEGYESERGQTNLLTILNAIDSLDLNSPPIGNLQRSQIFHLAHANAYPGDNGSSELLSFVNGNEKIDMDLAMIGFDAINPLITSDRNFIIPFAKSNKSKPLFRNAIETEGDSFVTLRKFSKSNEHDCKLWENALILALQVQNKWQLQLSLNFPNYSHIHNIPKIATWLLSSQAREKFMEDMNENFLQKSTLSDNDEVLSFYDYIVLTRASPAKSLGLAHVKGGFTPGADGDLNVLDIDLNKVDLSNDFTSMENALKNIKYVVKNGEIVKNEEKIVLNGSGNIFWASGDIEHENKERIMKKKKEFYQKYYSIFYDSLKVDLDDSLLRKIA